MLIKVASAMYLMDHADHVRPNTFAGYRSSLSAHVIPDLGDIEMEEFIQKESGFLCDLPPNVLSKKYKDFMISNGLPYVPMKNLRHSWATQALEAGMSLEDIMMYLRHTQMSTSYEHYIVRTNKMVHRIADMME